MKFGRKIKYLIILTSIILFCTIGCNLSTPPNGDEPIAIAGPDQTAKVGNYVALDGTASKKGNCDTLMYKWSADPSNPHQPFFLDNDPEIYIGCLKEGAYKFTLVVNNGRKDSKPDEVIFRVLPRTQVLFEDPRLEIAVRWGLRMPTQELNEQELLSVDSVLAYYASDKITRLQGIERCGNLRFLNMAHQRIADLSPLAGMTKLTYLSLSQNYIVTDIRPLANLTQLEWLDLQSNQVSDISALSGLIQLRNLNLMTNPISDLSALRNMTECRQLWLDYTRLADISVIARLTKLEVLWMTHCDVEDISALATLTKLYYLHLGNNRIRNIDALANCTEIERLYMDLNQVSDIRALKYLAKLNILDLPYNNITNIEPLVNNSGIGQGDLVSLQRNPLDSISINQYIPALRNRGVVVFWP